MTRTLPALICSTLLVAACGGGGGGTPAGDNGGSPAPKRLTIAVTDAPVDNATNVFVQFTGVELQSSTNGRIRFDLDSPQTIDLLAFTGLDSAVLLDTTEAPAGDYQFIRLLLNAEPSTLDSYVVFEDGSEVSIRVNRGELQLNSGFSIRESGLSSFTIDFDLRKALTDPQGQADIFLRPALRLVENTEVGVIDGVVEAGNLTAAGCTSDPDTGAGNAVYLWAGAGVTPDDEGSAGAPLASALVELDESTGDYVFTIGFVPAGDYTVAFSCQAGDDSADADDAITFVEPQDVSVVTDQTSSVTFVYVPPEGAISGTVAAELIGAEGCSADPDTGAGNAVYLFAGSDAMADDLGSPNEPQAVADVVENQATGEQEFGFGAVLAGDYTVAFTCQGSDDDPGLDDPLQFGAQQNVTVTGGETAVVDL